MAREIVDIGGIVKKLCLTKWQVYHLVHKFSDPLPHKKIGVKLYFDVERCLRWWDRQPGKDGEELAMEFER